MLTEILNKIINYDPDAATTSKVAAFNEILAKLIAHIEKILGI